MGSYRSKEDKVLKISTSIFIANFPYSFGAKDLWNTCKQYGQVVDAYIPYRRSKAGKRFGFVRFIKVLDVDRLVNNLSTVWVGRHKLQANILRFQREPLKRHNSLHNINGVKRGHLGDTYNSNGVKGAANSYAHVVKGSQNSKMDSDSSLVMVLDDSCLNEKDYYLFLMGKVKDFATLANLKVVVVNEGFDNIKFKYMGGVTWVEIEDSEIGSYEEVPNEEDVKNVEDLEGDSDGEIVPDTKFGEDFLNQKGEEDSVGQGHFKKSEVPKSGGSILQLIDDLVKVGETMGASVGNSGGILCVWDPNMFKKTNSTISDYFVMVRGDWIPNGKKLLIISVYAPQELSKKKMLWDYLSLVMSKWEGEVVIMGDFNEVRNKLKRFRMLFNRHGADVFDHFISNAGLEEVPLEGCSFTWCHRSATKMSKLDHFLILDSLLCSCLNISSITRDWYLSDHWPILMREDAPIIESNALVRMMKKLKYLKEKIRLWNKLNKEKSNISKRSLLAELADCDAIIDKGEGENNAKIKWAIEGDENSKYYHGVINKKRNQLSIRGILVEGTWIDSPSLVKRSMPIYHMSLFKVPKKVLHRMESMRSYFFNGAELSSKNLVWVKWKHALASKDKGGLGSSLWARVIKALHGYDGKIGQKVKSCYPSLWLDIIHEVEMFKSRGIDLALEGLGEFTITSVRKMIDDFMLPEVSSKTRWIKAVPIKVNVHAWKVKLDGLPTRLNISRRVIDIESILCPMYDGGILIIWRSLLTKNGYIGS
nr:RNA-directed DNA polymerase, eukaryota [Tanacetum cinerariifolium]